MENNFETLPIGAQDERVLQLVRGGADRFAVIHRQLDGAREDSSRPLDRCLQRLRRAGDIELVGKPRRWKAVP